MSENVANDVVAVRGLTKHYPGVQALSDATISIKAGEVRALLGRNGAGKSTLIRLLSGIEAPDSGDIEIDGVRFEAGSVRRAAELGVEPVHQELSLVPYLSVAENIFLGQWPLSGGRIDYRTMRLEARAVLDELGLSIDPAAMTGSLPIAEQQLIEIARAVRRSPKLLILDEPTSALAANEVTTVLDTVSRIASSGVAVIYVSHRLDEIRRVARTATVMRDGRIIETVDLADATTDDVVSLMLGDAAPTEHEEFHLRSKSADAPTLVQVTDLTVPPKLEGVSFGVASGEVVGIAGLMGSGRSELLRAVAGVDTFTHGSVTIGSESVDTGRPRTVKRLGVGMTPEDRKGSAIIPLLGVDENLTMARYSSVSTGPMIRWRRLRDDARDLIKRLSISAASSQTPIVNLSGGNQQKAVIGRWLHAGSRVLLLDEPTRGVDVKAKSEIYSLVRELARNGTAVIFVSSELEELPLVCDRVLVLRQGTLANELSGHNITTENVVAAAMSTD